MSKQNSDTNEGKKEVVEIKVSYDFAQLGNKALFLGAESLMNAVYEEQSKILLGERKEMRDRNAPQY